MLSKDFSNKYYDCRSRSKLRWIRKGTHVRYRYGLVRWHMYKEKYRIVTSNFIKAKLLVLSKEALQTGRVISFMFCFNLKRTSCFTEFVTLHWTLNKIFRSIRDAQLDFSTHLTFSYDKLIVSFLLESVKLPNLGQSCNRSRDGRKGLSQQPRKGFSFWYLIRRKLKVGHLKFKLLCP